MSQTNTSGKASLWIILLIIVILAAAAFVVRQRNLGEKQKGELLVSESEKTLSETICDDTDGGIAPFWKGTVSGKLPVSGEPTSHEDRCDGSLIVEYYCLDSRIQLTRMECPNGCKEGACQLGSSS